MKIVFRTDSSIKMGAGHLMRCFTLADELNKQNHQITFICRNLTGNLISLLEKKKYKVIIIPVVHNFTTNNIYLEWLGATQKYDAEQTIRVLPKNVDLLIIDSYALDEIWHQRLRKFTKKIMVIDDLADRSFDCDILLNQNLGAQIKKYKGRVSNECELLLGCDYALLRSEFPNLREIALEKRKNTKVVKNILISLGGIDEHNKTYDILKEIPDDLNIVVVLGMASLYNEMIKKYTMNKENIKIIVGADNMAELMLNADLAIGAGGSTSWERCCLGLPTLLYITANNQKPIAGNLEQIGAVKIVSNLKDDLHNILNNFSIWQFMSKRAQTVCDGLGVKRIRV